MTKIKYSRRPNDAEMLRERVIPYLRPMRRALGLTLLQVAERAGCSITSVGLAERGHRPNPPLVRRIAKALTELDAEAQKAEKAKP